MYTIYIFRIRYTLLAPPLSPPLIPPIATPPQLVTSDIYVGRMFSMFPDMCTVYIGRNSLIDRTDNRACVGEALRLPRRSPGSRSSGCPCHVLREYSTFYAPDYHPCRTYTEDIHGRHTPRIYTKDIHRGHIRRTYTEDIHEGHTRRTYT